MAILHDSKRTPGQPTAENRTFRRLLAASSVSMLGSHLTTIAYPLLVLRLTGSPFVTGCAVFAATAPSILVYIPAGALVDRWNPRRVMLISELGRGVAIATVVVTLALNKPMVFLLMVVAVVEGTLEVFSELAEQRYVRTLLNADQIPPALVGIEARSHFVVAAGRPLGGLLFGAAPILPFVADVASFICSILSLFRIKDAEPTSVPKRSSRRTMPSGSLLSDIRQGLCWIRNDRFARMAIISFSVGTLIFQALIIVFLSDAHARQLPGLAIGIVLAASGIGGALGSAVASRLLARVEYLWVPTQALIWVLGFCVLMLPVGQALPATAIIMATLGFTGAKGNIILSTHIARTADREIIARATSVARLVSSTACAVGPVIGGLLVQGFGTQHAMIYLFFFTPALIVLAALTPPANGPASARR